MKKSALKDKKTAKSHADKIGMAPGALIHVGDIKTKEVVVSLIEYATGEIRERTLDKAAIEDLSLAPDRKLWLNVHGLHDTELIASIGKAFKLHPLVLEDILNTDQRSKLDAYDDYLYIVARSFYQGKNSKSSGSEQISLIMGKHFLLSFQERSTGSFEPIRERLRNGVLIREAGTDYLAYTLLDVIVDRYFLMLEQMSDECETLEESLLKKPNTGLLHKIHRLKHSSMELRRSVWPLREMLSILIRNDYQFFSANTLLYLRDVYDHSVRFIESLEAIRDLLSGMLDIYMSSVSNRVNMELRALTVVAMLFMPATLIAGIFGMNFEFMPWLQDKDGFWLALMLMAAIASSMGLIFWRRQWLGGR